MLAIPTSGLNVVGGSIRRQNFARSAEASGLQVPAPSQVSACWPPLPISGVGPQSCLAMGTPLGVTGCIMQRRRQAWLRLGKLATLFSANSPPRRETASWLAQLTSLGSVTEVRVLIPRGVRQAACGAEWGHAALTALTPPAQPRSSVWLYLRSNSLYMHYRNDPRTDAPGVVRGYKTALADTPLGGTTHGTASLPRTSTQRSDTLTAYAVGIAPRTCPRNDRARNGVGQPDNAHSASTGRGGLGTCLHAWGW